MFKNFNIRIAIGIVLILAGLGALLQVSGLFGFSRMVNAIMVAVLFMALGGLFLGMLFSGRSNWWAAIPGAGLVALGLLIGLSVLLPQYAWLGGCVFLGLLGFSFWIIYVSNPARWWSIIPGGVLLTLAAVTVSDHFLFIDGGTTFFLGLAATFGLVYILPTGGEKMRWAWIPCIVMLAMAALVSSFTTRYANFIWPLLLIAFGIILAVRSIKTR